MPSAALVEAVTSEVLALLRRVRGRVTPPDTWTQDQFAATREGASCAVAAPDATCWCLEGAILAELPVGIDTLEVHRAVFDALHQTIGLRNSGLTLAGWNDAQGRTHEDVLCVLDVTIARLAQTAAEFHVTVNPTDTPDSVARRYRAVFGSEAFERCDEDADRAEACGLPRRHRLLDRASTVIRHEDQRAGLRDEWGDLLPAPARLQLAPSVYVCAAFARQEEMRQVRERLSTQGVGVTARWLDMPAAEPDSVAAQGAIAHVCHEDIRTATALLAFTEAPGSAYFTGGRHVEVGIALALARPVYVIGPVENVFHCHALSRRFPDVDAALATLKQEFPR